MHTDRTSDRNNKMATNRKAILSSPAIRWSFHIFLVLILNQIHRNFGSPVFTYNPSVTQFHIQSGRNIRHLPCVVRRSGIEGVCMFAIDCIKANGTHLGTCIDRFYFGSCCQLKDETELVETEIIENSIDQNTIPHFSFGSSITSTTATSLYSSPSSSSSSSSTASRITNATKGATPSISTVMSTTNLPKFTTANKPLTTLKPVTTTVGYIPITISLNTESKTENSNEQPIVDKVSETTVLNVVSSREPTTTEENIKLQTFQSVQDTTFTTSAPLNLVSSTTKKPFRKTTTATTPATTKTSAQSLGTSTLTTVASVTQTKPHTTTQKPITVHLTKQTISTKPTSAKPAPTKPTPTKPTPTKPTPTKSAPTKPTPTKSAPSKPTPTKSTSVKLTSTAPPSKRTEQPQFTRTTTAKPIRQKTTSSRPISASSPEKHSTIGATQLTSSITQTTQPSITTSTVTKPISSQKKKTTTNVPTTLLISSSTSASTTHPTVLELNTTKTTTTTPRTTTTTTTTTTSTTTTTTQMPDLVTWSNAETVKTEYPPEWILIPSVLPLATTLSQTVPSSTLKPATSTETTRFPTRKPTVSTPNPAITKKPITRPNIETAATKPVTKEPQTTTTTVNEKTPVTTQNTPTQATVTIETTDDEENLSTTESITIFDQPEETTTFTEIIETENLINHAISGLPSYTQSPTGTTVSEFNSTVPILLSEASVTSATTHSSIDRFTGQSTVTTARPSTLTTILLPSVKPEYEKLPTIKPVISLNDKTTTSTTIASNTVIDTSNTIAYNQTSVPSSTVDSIEEATDRLTTITKIESTSEAITSADIASSSMPLTTFEAYDVENSTVENVTLEFIDLPTTEAVSTTSSILQYLETASYKQVCGKRMYPEPRIVGGSKASFGRWPWQISLRQWRTSTYLHKCGAALLNENWAITAAHCVDNVPPSDLLLRLGEYDLAEEEEPYLYQERRVQIVASHPQFDPRTFEYDLALLRFYEPVAFQPNIIPVCVPDSDENFIGRTAFVTGWGRLYEDGPLPSVLQEVSVPVINNTLCEGMYRNAGYIEHIPHIFICAGWRKGGYDSCEGDSGGPMVIQREDKRFLLAGVISWGIGCAEPNQPGVYTRISEFREWINQILQF